MNNFLTRRARLTALLLALTLPLAAQAAPKNARNQSSFRGYSRTSVKITDGSLHAAKDAVLRLREKVWSGRLAPERFYPATLRVYRRRFGPDYEAKIRAFLAPPPESASEDGPVDFERMTGKDRRLFFERMPKGGELHLHMTGAVGAERLLELARRFGVEFSARSVGESLAQMGEDPARYGLDGREIIGAREMGPALQKAVARAMATHAGDRDIDDFHKKWDLIGPIGHHDEAIHPLLKTIAAEAKRQNVLYLEVMASSDPGRLERAAREARKVQRESGVTIRLLSVNGWHQSAEEVRKVLKTAMRLKKYGVVGHNMIRDETNRRPLAHYDSFAALRRSAPRFPVSLHAGEKPGSADNIVNDLLLNVRRLGHATQLDENPASMALLYALRLPVEVSLISNQKTRVMTDLSRHPLPRLLAWGVPVVLSSDDPGIFQSNLSQEYDLAQKQFRLGWASFKDISRNALRFSFLEEPSKKRLTRLLEERLRRFESSALFRRYARRAK